MTKARTKARSRRAGRKRGMGRRYPGGKLVLTNPKEDALYVVLARRCRHIGIPSTPPNMQAVKDNRYGSRLGQMALAGRITEAEEEAGYRYAELEADYGRVMGFPRRHASGACYGELRGERGEFSPEKIEAVRSRHAACQAVFRRLGVLPRRLLRAVALDEDAVDGAAAINALRIGLSAMAAHFAGERRRG